MHIFVAYLLFVTPLVVILVVLHSAILAGTHPASVVVVFLSTKVVVRKQNFWRINFSSIKIDSNVILSTVNIFLNDKVINKVIRPKSRASAFSQKVGQTDKQTDWNFQKDL